ncbi:MAG: GIY-YIG nuclease family protein, partial [Acidimicrobiales bacterium]|nr:GIY-YIG nuclease family protein [Acidimicrobiales bacterium]
MIERPLHIPDAPGSYQFYNRESQAIYVGKARSLKNRISSYFVNPERLHERTRQMMRNAVRVEWIQVNSELDALLLEHSLIKTHQPKY